VGTFIFWRETKLLSAQISLGGAHDRLEEIINDNKHFVTDCNNDGNT
jgi:hypothetical protein